MKKRKFGAFINALFGGLFAKPEKAFQWSDSKESEFSYESAAGSHPAVDQFFFSHLNY